MQLFKWTCFERSDHHQHAEKRPWRCVLGAFAMLAMLLPVGPTSPAYAQEAWEWEPDEGYHEEEWYDPSDWFDDDTTIDYEYDDGYYGDYDYGYDAYDYGYGDEYVYDDYTAGEREYEPLEDEWAYEEDYDYYDDWYYTEEWYEDEGVYDEWYE